MVFRKINSIIQSVLPALPYHSTAPTMRRLPTIPVLAAPAVRPSPSCSPFAVTSRLQPHLRSASVRSSALSRRQANHHQTNHGHTRTPTRKHHPSTDPSRTRLRSQTPNPPSACLQHPSPHHHPPNRTPNSPTTTGNTTAPTSQSANGLQICRNYPRNTSSDLSENTGGARRSNTRARHGLRRPSWCSGAL